MPRIRTTKPEFFRSPDTLKVDFPVRIFYQALWCWADDFGVGETNINGLLGFAFGDDDVIYDRELGEFRAVTAQDVRRFCADVARAFGTVFYTVRGRRYYAIPSWEKHQKTERRTERRRHPGPDDPDATPDLRILDGADSAPQLRRESGAESALEQGNRGTGEQGKEKPSSSEDAPTAEVVELCDYLADRIEANGSKRPTVTAGWLRACRLMIERDGRTPEQIRRAIDWCQADGFWRANILSMPKLREKFDTLRLQASRGSARPPGTDDRVRGHLELAERLARQEQPLEILG